MIQLFKYLIRRWKKNSAYAKAYYNRSLIYKAKGEYQKAINDVLKVMELGLKVKPTYLQELRALAATGK